MTDFVRILGPCAVETQEEFVCTAHALADIMGDRNWIYKCSALKANRTAWDAPMGPGFHEFLEWVQVVKDEIPGIRMLTDVHQTQDVEMLADVFDVDRDIVQVPAFLCRQTDLLAACGEFFRHVNVKIGQFLSPRSARYIPEKVTSGDTCPTCVTATIRGTQVGYENLLPDFGAVPLLAEAFDGVWMDSGHSTQRANANDTTKGSRDLAARYFVSARIFGFGGVYQEVHPDPDNAISDSSMQIPLSRVQWLVEREERVAKCL